MTLLNPGNISWSLFCLRYYYNHTNYFFVISFQTICLKIWSKTKFKEVSCKAPKVYLDFLIQFDSLVQLMCWINSFTFCLTTVIVIFWLLLFVMRSQLTFFLFPRMEFIFFLCFWDFLFILVFQQFECDGPMYGFVCIFTAWVLWTFWIYMFLLNLENIFG